MRKITGDLLKICREEEEKVMKVLQGMSSITFRDIEFEYCNTYRSGGHCITYGNSDSTAIIRLSTKFDHTDRTILRHELIHAFLPQGVHHGSEFMYAMALLNKNRLPTSRFTNLRKEKPEYKYEYTCTLPSKEVLTIKRMRKTYTIEWLESQGGEGWDRGRYFKLVKTR